MADKPVMTRRLWLPWKLKIGGEEIRLSSEDVYAALEAGSKALFHNCNVVYPQDIERRIASERNMAIIDLVEQELKVMFGQALKENPAPAIPGRKTERALHILEQAEADKREEE